MGIFEEITAIPLPNHSEVEVEESSIFLWSFDPGKCVFNQTLTKFELGPTQPKLVDLLLVEDFSYF